MKRLLKEMFIIGAGGIALIYLLNPTAGLLEFIPDVSPSSATWTKRRRC